MSQSEEQARAALRRRQGTGARYDAASAPSQDLRLARRGTAFFARRLNDLADADFRASSAIEGWSRAMVIAYVGLHARLMAEAIEQMQSADNRLEPDPVDVLRARTLSPSALRHLAQHSAKHLDVTWRDLPDAGWTNRALKVACYPLVQTPRLRAEVVWHAGHLLVPGGRLSYIPEAIRATTPFAQVTR